MSYEDLERFDTEILDIENPSLQRYLVNQEPLNEEHNTHYMGVMVLYVQKRKENYAKYTPGIVY